MKMEKSVKITGIIAITVIVLVVIGISVFSQLSSGNTVTAQGISELDVMPDLVSVNFYVETTGKTAAEAKDANTEITDNLITALVKQGFERKDIQTQNFNVYPEYDYDYSYDSQKIKDYKATHYIIVKFSTEDTDLIGEAIDAGVDAGAMISYINFELSQELQNTYKAEALRLAGEDAKMKAEATAEGLDKQLGSLVSVSTSDFGYYPWVLYDNAGFGAGRAESAVMAKEAVSSIQPGEQSVSASISVVYKLK